MKKKVDQDTVEFQSSIFDHARRRQEWQHSDGSIKSVLSYMRKYGTPEQKASLIA